MQEILTVDAPAGSGKTYATLSYAERAVKVGHKILLCQPSKRLIDGTVADAKTRFPDMKCNFMYTEEDDDPCVPRIVEHFRYADPNEGELYIITHAAFERLPFLHCSKQWEIIFDEIPQISWYRQFRLAEHKNELLGLFDAHPRDSVYSQLECHNADEPDAIIRNKRNDEFWECLGDLSFRLRSDNYVTFACTDQLEKFRSGVVEVIDGTPQETTVLPICSFRTPHMLEKFKSATVMGANLTESVMHFAWRKDVNFTPHPFIRPRRTTAAANGHLLTIYYAHEVPWSKAKRDRMVDGRAVIEEDVRRVEGLFAGAPMAFMANLDSTIKIANGVQLPNTPHGLNTFQDIHNVAAFSALNPDSCHMRFLMDKAGMTKEQVLHAIFHEPAAQAIERGSLRNPADLNPKQAVFMDRQGAEWFQQKYPGSALAKLPGVDLLDGKIPPGRKKLHNTQADKKQKERMRKKKEELLEELRKNCKKSVPKYPYTIGYIGTEILQNFPSWGLDEPIEQQYFRRKTCSLPCSIEGFPDTPTYIAHLERLAGMAAYHKEDGNILHSPAVFDLTPMSGKRRGNANVRYLRHVMLDNDHSQFGNGIPPAEFAALFPDVRMYIYNSHGNSAVKQKYRVLIPTQQRMTANAHKFIIQEIMTRLRAHGYRNKNFFDQAKKSGTNHNFKLDGFDTTKFTPCSLFYLPCQAAAGPEYSFFECFHENAPVMDVEAWIRDGVQSCDEEDVTPPAIATKPSGGISASPGLAKLQSQVMQDTRQPRIDAAIEQWRSTPAGDGNSGFFRLGVALRHAGCDEAETGQILRAELSAAPARSRSDRKKQIPSILKNLY